MRKTLVWSAVALLALGMLCSAQTALKTINNPGGGMIVYGLVDGQTSEAGAMGAILRSLHSKYGDKPQVGRPFRVKGSNSVAAYFTLTKKTQGNSQIAGLLIADRVADNRVEAAVVSDDAARFRQTINPMLKTLFGAWHPAGAVPVSAPASSAAVAGLHPVVVPDHSAGASLPPGWEMTPGNGGGTLFAKGPDGEAAFLGFAILAGNSRDPRVQQTMRFAQGAGRNTMYANAIYYPYGGDLGKSFVDLLNLWRGKRGLAPGTVDFTANQRVPSAPGTSCAYLAGRANFPDAKGPGAIDVVFCLGPLGRMGSYMAFINETVVPAGRADKERPTMQAVLQSFWVDQAKVNAQAAAIAKPAIDAIHEIGRRAAQQAADAHAMSDAHNRSVEKMWDSRDKSNQAFSNYLLDQTVIQDNYQNAHGTVWNQTADALVKADPNRYEYVPTPNFWKGIDY